MKAGSQSAVSVATLGTQVALAENVALVIPGQSHYYSTTGRQWTALRETAMVLDFGDPHSPVHFPVINS